MTAVTAICDVVVPQYRMNLMYAGKLAADLSDEQACRPAGPGHENHPVFTLGHLCVASAMVMAVLADPRDLPDQWSDLFERQGPSDRRLPETDPGAYPPIGDVLAELTRQHGRVESRLATCSENELSQAREWRLSSVLPKVVDLVTFLCVTHEAIHLGQLAAWRRAMGLPAALAAT